MKSIFGKEDDFLHKFSDPNGKYILSQSTPKKEKTKRSVNIEMHNNGLINIASWSN